MKKILLAFMAIAIFGSCVSKKKFTELQSERDMLQDRLKTELEDCNNRIADLEAQLQNVNSELLVKENELGLKDNQLNKLEQQLEYMKSTNTNLLDRLSDLSVVSKSGAESIKNSLEALNRQNEYIQSLTEKIQRKDSINLSLVMNLKRSLADVNDEDVHVEVRKGVVYVSLSDKMLFNTASAVVSKRAEEVLGKVAKVLKDHGNLEILVEGHTDSVPISTDCIKDNWDLSVKRATSVVRVLQNKYDVDPARMTAGGRSKYMPKESNETAAGRSTNRRTEIIITPKLDEFFKLMEPPTGASN